MQIWLQTLKSFDNEVSRLLGASGKLRGIMQGVAHDLGWSVIKDYQRTTRTWNHNVDFQVRTGSDARGVFVKIGTEDAVYSYVNWGADRHVIVPRGMNSLRFQWGGYGSYRAKTRIFELASRSGGPTGPIVYSKRVKHPGITPRRFDLVITDKWETIAQDTFANAIAKFWAGWAYKMSMGSLNASMNQANAATGRAVSRAQAFWGP